MRVERYDDPAAFWRDAQAFLERDEIGNTQLLAIGSRHASDSGKSPPVCYAVTSAGEVVAAAVMTHTGTLFLSPADTAQLSVLHDSIAAAESHVGDIVAEVATAQAYAQLTGIRYAVHVGLRLYRLEAVSPVPVVAGALRAADDGDFELLCRWQQAFLDEIAARETGETSAQMVRRRLASGGAWLWEVDGAPVAHAGHRPTPIRSARIAPVYTLPDQRGKGYAGALVAAVCRELLAAGRHPLYLFADALNPSANGIYQRVGFHEVGEHVHLMRADTAH